MGLNMNIDKAIVKYIGCEFEHKEGGFDCKGFVEAFLADIGTPISDIHLYPVASLSALKKFYKQWSEVKQKRAGDVLLFKNKNGNIYHIGIAVNKFRFIHNTKNGVLLSEVGCIWKRRLAGVYRRL